MIVSGFIDDPYKPVVFRTSIGQRNVDFSPLE